ncbi:hypothetical protein ACFO4N_12490 [Camelliibacillus cellulosilyticus]|uniref:Uncharacterized protein n=1 Tax=Camelliibacillus cellulosilyticus TaxID=2174486 RepID=A0ABV9GRI4_9BACL
MFKGECHSDSSAFIILVTGVWMKIQMGGDESLFMGNFGGALIIVFIVMTILGRRLVKKLEQPPGGIEKVFSSVQFRDS